MNETKPTDSEIQEIIETLKKESKNNKTIQDHLQFSYEFLKNDFSITPLQKKGEIYTLIKLLEKTKPKRILEIGTAGGGTLFLLSKTTAPNSLIISVDLPAGKFGGEHFPDWKIPIFKNFAEEKQKIYFIRKDSHSDEALQEIKSLLANEFFDFILVDGDHSHEGVQKDLEMYLPLLNKNGIMAFHDIIEGPKENVGGVPEFWKQIKSKNKTAEIVDSFGEICCGIGLLFTREIKPQIHENILNSIIEIQKIRIKDLFHDTQKIKESVFHDPLTSLLNLYYERKDIQIVFPEVKKGNFAGLIRWAQQICDNPPKEELVTKRLLEKHLEWYNQFLASQKEITKKSDDLTKNKIENAELTANLDLQQQENAELTANLDLQQQENAKLTANLDLQQQENAKLTANLDLQQQENAKLTANLDLQQQENAKLTDSLEIQQQENAKLTDSLEIQQQENAKLTANLDLQQQENAKLTDSLEIQQQENAKLTDSLEIQQQENAKLTDSLEIQQQENAKLSDSLEIQQQENAKLQEMIADLNFELLQTRKEIDEIKNSRGFRALRFFGSKIDKMSKKKSIIKDIESTVSASKKTIENEGFSTFASIAKEKIKRKEFLLQSPSYLSSSVNLPSNNSPKFNIEKQNLEPKFSASVIIPTNSDEKILAPLVQNLTSQTGFKNLKIIVINSGTKSLKNLEKVPNFVVLSIKPEEFSHGKVRNLGMAESVGDYVFFISDDVLLPDDHLFYDMCQVILNDKKIAVVSARQIPRSDADLMAIFSLDEYYESLGLSEDRTISTDNFDSLNSTQKRQVAQVDDVCSCYRLEIISKHLFGKVKYAEDLDIGTRFIKEGLKICQLYSRGVIHSHRRPASYYLKRSFVETKVLSSLLDYHSFDFNKNKINSFQDFTQHVFSLYSSLSSCIGLIQHQKSVNTSQIFELLKKQLPENYSVQKDSNQSDISLDDIFKKFPKTQDVGASFLLADFQSSLNHFQVFLQNTYPNISGIEKDFFDTLYKLFANIVGGRLAGFEINMEKQGSKEGEFEKIAPILEAGV